MRTTTRPGELPDRQVDHAADDDEGLAEREDAERRRLVEHVGEVRGRAELRDGRAPTASSDQEQAEDAVAAERAARRVADAARSFPDAASSVALSSTQPNFMAKFLSVAACRSGAKDETASRDQRGPEAVVERLARRLLDADLGHRAGDQQRLARRARAAARRGRSSWNAP